MKRQKTYSWILLLILIFKIAVNVTHIHEHTHVHEVTCKMCLEGVPHNGHLDENDDDDCQCIICQLLTVSFNKSDLKYQNFVDNFIYEFKFEIVSKFSSFKVETSQPRAPPVF